MKIVIVQGAFLPVPPIQGGAVEKIWFRLGQEFAARGHEVMHLSRRHPDLSTEEVIEGVRHRRVGGAKAPRSLAVLKALDLFYSLRVLACLPRDADIVVTNTFWLPILLRGKIGKSVCVDVQRMPKGQICYYRHVGRLRANSTPVREAILAELPPGMESRVEMIPNPLPFLPTPGAGTARGRVLLYVGRIHPEKGLKLMLQALRKCDLREWTVRLVGPWETADGGGGRQFLEELRGEAKGLPVEFAGPLHDMEALNACYREAALFCYPSIAEKGETFGLAPLEAMAWGCVPVVSDLGCFKDFIRPGVNGAIFDHRGTEGQARLAAELTRLMGDPARIETLSRKALEVRATHSAAVIAETFLEDFARMKAHE